LHSEDQENIVVMNGQASIMRCCIGYAVVAIVQISGQSLASETSVSYDRLWVSKAIRRTTDLCEYITEQSRSSKVPCLQR